MNNRAIEHWDLLNKSGEGDGLIEVPSIDSGIETGFGNARYAIGPQGQQRLLIPMAVMNLANKIPSTSKIKVSFSSFKFITKNVFFIDIMNIDPTLNSVFGELVEDILRRIEDGVSPVQAIKSAINDFRELLQENTEENVNQNKIIGLIGELETLRILSTYNKNAFKAWVGPFSQRHDFRQNMHALEVKSSCHSGTTKVSIHGIEQLEPPSNGSLHLIHIRFERLSGAGLSVGGLFEAILHLGADSQVLRERIKACGCSDPHAEVWNRDKYIPKILKVYLVEEGFPRIVNSSFKSGFLDGNISELNYDIDLKNASSFEILEEEQDLLWKKMVMQ